MTTPTQDTQTPSDSTGTTQVHNLPLVIHAQYVRDISFENPNSPNSLRPGQDTPKIDVTINLEARAIEDDKIKNLYEVVLKLGARADRKEYPVFIAELHYAVTVSMPDVPADQHHPLLLVEVPKIAFPFARKILADLTQDGGYPPLLVGQIDFYGMYMSKFAKKPANAATN